MTDATYLQIKWTTSRGAETYGWNVVTLTDTATGKRYRANGGGYDMQGTVFADWLQDTHQDELRKIATQAHTTWQAVADGPWSHETNRDGLYGMAFYAHDGRVVLDGACGLSSIERVADAIGLDVRHTVSSRGHLIGFQVTTR